MGNEPATLFASYEEARMALPWIDGPAMFTPEVFEFTACNGTTMRLVLTGVHLEPDPARPDGAARRPAPIAQLQYQSDGKWLDAWTTDPMLVALYMSVRSRLRS
jgi:hypothetical protein